MRSHLTRYVLRNILYNEPLSHARCLRLPASVSCRPTRPTSIVSNVTTRSLWGFSRKPKREPGTVDLDPGFGEMLGLIQALKVGMRPPPLPVMIEAFNSYFRARQKSPTPLEEIQAIYALKTYKHVQQYKDNLEGAGFSEDDLQVALKVLTNKPGDRQFESYKELAELIFEELKERRPSDLSQEDTKDFFGSKALLPFIQVLSQHGASLKARGLIEEYWKSDLESGGRIPWMHVLRGFAKENNDTELLRTVDIMKSCGVPFDAKAHQTISIYYAQKDDVESTKRWFGKPIADQGYPTNHAKAFVLRMCIRQGEFEWGDAIFKSMLERDPDKRAWNIIFEWAAAKGKGVDEIEKMMDVMVRRNEEKGNNARPDIETINGLVELANSRNDSYTAERYMALAQKWHIEADAQTYLLQLDYRIKVGDLDGAKSTYNQLQSLEIPQNKDVPLVSRLIVALAKARRQDYDAIMRLVEDLAQRKVRFEPDTVSALCLLHLQKNELHDVIDLLQTHTFHYGMDQRAMIRNVFVEFTLDRSNDTTKAWDSYCIMREIFQETGVDIRTRLMNEFFARERSDMAYHVFGHMRQKSLKEERPTVDTYVECLEGIAKARDSESLEMVHNMLKLDTEVEPNTRLYNALMLSFMACGSPVRSLQFWEDIIYSREGPTYNSIQIVLRACEVSPFGERSAREVWNKLHKFEIEITREMYASYVGAIARNTSMDEATRLLEGMEAEIGSPPDAST